MKTAMLKFVSSTVFSVALLVGIQSASAVTWNIVEILAGSSGFGASSFHDASSGSPASGGIITDITLGAGTFGTYDDDTGLLTATGLPIVLGGQTFSLSGTLLFGGGSSVFGTLETDSVLEADFSGTGLPNPDSSGNVDPFELGFMDDYVCCGESGQDPNSFVEFGSAGIMTLWGADGFLFPNASQVISENYADSRFGMDLRLALLRDPGMNVIPIPAALPLFAGGLGLLGLLGWRRRRIAGAAA